MSLLTIIGIAIGLAMDAFAVSLAAGLAIGRLTGRHVFRAAFHFGLFQFMMPVAGWFAGRTIAQYMAACNHWIAFGLLAFVGGKMIWDAGQAEHPRGDKDPTRGWSLVILSVATSLDALAVGFSMALLGVSIWLPSIIIGLVAAAMSLAGILIGSRLGGGAKRWAERLGGLILIAIGLRILIEHLSG